MEMAIMIPTGLLGEAWARGLHSSMGYREKGDRGWDDETAAAKQADPHQCFTTQNEWSPHKPMEQRERARKGGERGREEREREGGRREREGGRREKERDRRVECSRGEERDVKGQSNREQETG